MSFMELLGELEALNKSLPAAAAADEDDEKIAAAAADGAAAGEAVDADANGVADEGEGGEGDEPMAKSFSFQLEDGTQIDAVDGTEMVKSLMARVEKTESSATAAFGQVLGVLKSQSDLIKSLQADVKRLSGEGRGRKAVVSVAEKPAAGEMHKSQPSGMSENEFMAKALQAQAAGRLSALDVSVAEAHFAKGLQVPADLIARVVG